MMAPRSPEPARRVGRWLLQGPAVLHDGPDAGAIVGWVDETGRAPFVYPEICGYHLSWLAHFLERSPEHHDEITACAEGLLDWLEAHDAAHGRFITRIFDAPQDDWRNRAEFTFDLGMILRGLDAIELALPTLGRPALRLRCRNRILAAVTPEGQLGSHRVLPGAKGDDLPRRWSTTPGPHLLKVAAKLLADPGAEEVAGATITHHVAALEGPAPLPPAHPALYAVEGLLEAGVSRGRDEWLVAAETLWRQVVDRELRVGGLPGPGRPPGAGARADVLAQVLRAGRRFHDLGWNVGDAGVPLDLLEETLVAAIRPDGAVPFHYAAPAGHRQDNTWAAQFTYQALLGSGEHAASPRVI